MSTLCIQITRERKFEIIRLIETRTAKNIIQSSARYFSSLLANCSQESRKVNASNRTVYGERWWEFSERAIDWIRFKNKVAEIGLPREASAAA